MEGCADGAKGSLVVIIGGFHLQTQQKIESMCQEPPEKGRHHFLPCFEASKAPVDVVLDIGGRPAFFLKRDELKECEVKQHHHGYDNACMQEFPSLAALSFLCMQQPAQTKKLMTSFSDCEVMDIQHTCHTANHIINISKPSCRLSVGQQCGIVKYGVQIMLCLGSHFSLSNYSTDTVSTDRPSDLDAKCLCHSINGGIDTPYSMGSVSEDTLFLHYEAQCFAADAHATCIVSAWFHLCQHTVPQPPEPVLQSPCLKSVESTTASEDMQQHCLFMKLTSAHFESTSHKP
ncbi:uncharacterized protein F5147DRAFT_653740 [Suillus discolor]|uniref:Uncharacterized protein n=1 Tax=Suillus discolor TaxID=1912936 RepID=A0A9P7F6D9_9AGAM|nr:uncharacterized protein F5147DRAFT_653740 [Suillus discolor]KAG2106776.1 hypothetical protein F5147DRAFT_653740 [Suillus discolor]